MASTQIRQQVVAGARRVVVKLGTQVLTGKDGRLDLPFFREVARQVSVLRSRGVEVTLVSSGAIGAGVAHLSLPGRPRDVAALQAVAAVGQPQLMRNMREAFEPFGLKVGQLLLTRSDFDDRIRFLNLRNCIHELHQMGCVPVVNENDTVAVDEIRFGDNDLLAGLLCNALRADALVLLSVVDGLLDGEGKVVDLVEDVGATTGLIRDDKSKLGTGGMVTKHAAAAVVTEAGEVAVIANGRSPDVLLRLFAGERVGTVFAPRPRKLDSRLRWIGLTKRPDGKLTIDDGAAAAVAGRGKSLLASGIVGCDGEFEKGAVLVVVDGAGRRVAQGQTNFSAEEIRKVMGKKSSQFEKLLGRPAYAEVIHCDNMVVLTKG